VQRSDEVAVVKNCPIVFACDRKARATYAASWYRQMGYQEVYAVDGGTVAWVASGRPLAQGTPEDLPIGYEAAHSQVHLVSPQT
jgi:rhodanese-related sulfurtransferase